MRAMGMSGYDLGILLTLQRQGLIVADTKVAELGAQQLSSNLLACTDAIKQLGEGLGVTAPWPLPVPDIGQRDGMTDAASPRARLLWDWLGLESITIDIDGTPGTNAFDPPPRPPPRRWGRARSLLARLWSF
jgi:hypothetical protein